MLCNAEADALRRWELEIEHQARSTYGSVASCTTADYYLYPVFTSRRAASLRTTYMALFLYASLTISTGSCNAATDMQDAAVSSMQETNLRIRRNE
eukprot:6176940-Pleurochrysis_carterae.AAC.2